MRLSLITTFAGSLVLILGTFGIRPAHAESLDPVDIAASADRAITALSPHVAQESHPEALQRAFLAYFAFQAAHPEMIRNPYYFFVDYGLANTTPRGYVFDMAKLELVEGPFTVAHGRGSLRTRNGVPSRFSNVPGSYMSSLGLYVTQETYRFSGKSGGRRYHSVGLRLRGVSGDFNSAARRRGIVSHGAPYVSARDAGRSEGCPAMEESRARRLLPQIADGGLVYLFSPKDTGWMQADPWSRTIRG
ncbi:MAG TPA: murein L,D-transpeptidase catalytic domain family protein [Longimicrobiales bacterium]|nr:murein L,D-transpeptidase catalytic domain family protein [Longimicrobiales bacterium]